MPNTDIKPRLNRHNIKEQLPFLPWHTLLFIIYMFIYGYRSMIGDVYLAQVVEISLYFLMSALILFGILQYFLGIYKAGVTVLIISIAFFLFGHIYHIYIYVYPEITRILPLGYLALTITLIVLVILIKYPLREFSKSLNILAVILSIIAIIQFFQFVQILEDRRALESIYDPLALPVDTLSIDEALPDIYFLVFDAYPSNSYLADNFNIDNSAFTDALEARGLYVAYDANSNYTSTKASISATLNLSFVQDIAPPDRDVNYDVLDSYMSNSRVARMLQDVGYHYIHFGNGYTETLPTVADTIIDVTPEGEIINDYASILDGRTSFWDYLTVTTAIRILDPTLSANSDGFSIAGLYSRVRFLNVIDALGTIPDIPEPTFTYFHVMKPHLPIVLTATGEPFRWTDIYANEVDYLNNQEIHYEDQLTYINQQILDTIDYIFEVSETEPIIIIQADHGSVLTRNETRILEINRPTPILSAFYFPDQDYNQLYSDISPINTFPVVFNQFFNTDYELLDDDKRYYLIWGDFSSLFFDEIPEDKLEPPYN